MRIELVGEERLERLLVSGLADRAGDELAAALYQEGEGIMTRSKRDFVPVDLGILRDSGHVALPEQIRDRVSVELGYGGAAAAYALIQHERLDYHHETGQAKYLEQPVLEASRGLAARLGRRIDLQRGL